MVSLSCLMQPYMGVIQPALSVKSKNIFRFFARRNQKKYYDKKGKPAGEEPGSQGAAPGTKPKTKTKQPKKQSKPKKAPKAATAKPKPSE